MPLRPGPRDDQLEFPSQLDSVGGTATKHDERTNVVGVEMTSRAAITASRLQDRLIELTAITSHLSADQSAQSVLGKAILLRHLVPEIDKCVVLLFGEEDGQLRIAASVAIAPDQAVPLMAVEIEQRLWSTTAVGRPASFPDIMQNRRLESLWPLAETAGLRAIWTLPLLDSRSEIIGWIIYGSSVSFAPDDEDRTLAVLFVNHLTVALRQAQLFQENQRRLQELSALHHISMRTGATVADLDRMLQRLLNELGELIGPSFGLLFLQNRAKAIEIKATYNLSKEDWPAAEEMGRRVMEMMGPSGPPLLIGDATEASSLGPLVSRFALRSLFCIPLRVRNNTAGVVILGDHRPHAYSSADGRLISTACNQASTVLENALLFAETKRRQSELAYQRKQLATIFRSISDGLVLVDGQGTIIAVNRACCQLTGRAEKELLGQQIVDVFGPEMESLGEESLPGLGARASRTDTRPSGIHPRYVDISHTRKDGQPVDLSVGRATVVAGKGETVAVITMRDVSQRKDLERMKADFVSTISHDLRTFLTAIKGYATTLQLLEEETVPQQRKRYLQAIDNATNRISRLVSDMLDLSRFEAGHLRLNREPLFLDCVVGDLVAETQAQTSIHTLQLLPHGPMPLVDADKGKIEQVLANLLDNAIKYSPAGGTIGVQIARVTNRRELTAQFGRRRATELGANPAGWVTVTVEDRGVGVPEGQIECLFEKFFRVENELTAKTRGSGLGLYICRAIIEAHGGRIWARSKQGQGTAITFALPASATDLSGEDW